MAFVMQTALAPLRRAAPRLIRRNARAFASMTFDSPAPSAHGGFPRHAAVVDGAPVTWLHFVGGVAVVWGLRRHLAGGGLPPPGRRAAADGRQRQRGRRRGRQQPQGGRRQRKGPPNVHLPLELA